MKVFFAMTDARRKKLIRRLVATPMPRHYYLLSFVLSRLVLLVAEVGVLLGFAALVFQVPLRGSLLGLTGLCVLGALMFGALGLLIRVWVVVRLLARRAQATQPTGTAHAKAASIGQSGSTVVHRPSIVDKTLRLLYDSACGRPVLRYPGPPTQPYFICGPVVAKSAPPCRVTPGGRPAASATARPVAG